MTGTMHARMASCLIVASFAAAGIAPLAAYAQATPAPAGGGFSSDGIFDCNGAESYRLSVGVSANGGSVVPVDDRAVVANTERTVRNLGYLVYKECVLRNIVDRMSESAGIAFVRRELQAFNAGNDGRPFFVQDFTRDQVETGDRALYNTLVTNDELNTLHPLYRDTVKRAIVRAYQEQTRAANRALACNYAGNLQALIQGNPEGSLWEGLAALQNPMCNPLFAYLGAESYANRNIASAEDEWRTRLTWGQGTHDRTITDKQGKLITVTPASIINSLAQQAVTSGFRKTENANDIGQMVGALFASMGTHILSDSQGLAGITQADGGQPSYLDQATRQSSEALIDSALNTALQILNTALQAEQRFNQTVSSIASNIVQTGNQLRDIEDRCWSLIIQHTCSSPVSFQGGLPSCSSSGGTTLRIATSTVFSRTVITAQIVPLASSTRDLINSSNQALALIQQLIDGVTNTTSRDAQNLAIRQLDQLVARRVLHTQDDVANAQRQASAVQDNLSTLITNTTQTWGDASSTPSNPFNPDSGWCNVNDPATVSMWQSIWSR